MLFSASFTSINGSTEGTVQWGDIDIGSSSLTVAGMDVPLTESSGTADFDLDGLEGLILIDFETGTLPSLQVDLPPAEEPEIVPKLPGLLGYDLEFFF